MKTLVVYYSFTRNNEKLAYHLHQAFDCDLLKIQEPGRRSKFTILLDILFRRFSVISTEKYDLEKYDHIIFVAPIWAAQIAAPLKTFIRNEGKRLGRYSFMTLCGGVAGQKEKIQRQLIALTGKRPNMIMELWLNKILTAERRNTKRHTSDYRVTGNDLSYFDPQIDYFFQKIGGVNEITAKIS